MNEYINIIKSAIDKIDKDYYKLETTYEPSGIVRERVFCYELYHQIRCLFHAEEPSKFKLNGEIDKRGHKDFEEKDRKNPDFVFHIPAEFEGNTFVMEVKGRIDDIGEIIKDLKTISIFIHKYQYKFGIFLLYNHNYKELLEALGRKQEEYLDLPELEKIHVLCKKSYAEKIECNKLTRQMESVL